MLKSKNYAVFLAPADEMPNILKEIGRQTRTIWYDEPIN